MCGLGAYSVYPWWPHLWPYRWPCGPWTQDCIYIRKLPRVGNYVGKKRVLSNLVKNFEKTSGFFFSKCLIFDVKKHYSLLCFCYILEWCGAILFKTLLLHATTGKSFLPPRNRLMNKILLWKWLLCLFRFLLKCILTFSLLEVFGKPPLCFGPLFFPLHVFPWKKNIRGKVYKIF